VNRFTYIPADQTDLRESMKKYRKLVEDENRRLHSGKQEASSPNLLGREVFSQQEQGLQHLRLVATGGEG
jgi:hypothetical protein